jgi:hypothetical protein
MRLSMHPATAKLSPLLMDGAILGALVSPAGETISRLNTLTIFIHFQVTY